MNKRNSKFKAIITWLVPAFIGMSFAIMISFTEGSTTALNCIAGLIGVTFTNTIQALGEINKKIK